MHGFGGAAAITSRQRLSAGAQRLDQELRGGDQALCLFRQRRNCCRSDLYLRETVRLRSLVLTGKIHAANYTNHQSACHASALPLVSLLV